MNRRPLWLMNSDTVSKLHSEFINTLVIIFFRQALVEDSPERREWLLIGPQDFSTKKKKNKRMKPVLNGSTYSLMHYLCMCRMVLPQTKNTIMQQHMCSHSGKWPVILWYGYVSPVLFTVNHWSVNQT